MEGHEGAGLVLQVFRQVFGYVHEGMVRQVVRDAFPGQADADVGDSRFFSPFFLAFRQVQGDAIADAEGPFIGINRHDRAEMAQGAEEEIHRRQAAHGDFIDEIGGHGGERLLVTALQGVHDGLVEEDAFGGIAVWRIFRQLVG